MNKMIDLGTGIILLLVGLSFVFKWYKNKNKTDINSLLYDKNKYEIVNGDKLFKLQTIKYILSIVCCISVGIVGLYFSSKFYFLGFAILGTLEFVFDGLSKEYVKLKS